MGVLLGVNMDVLLGVKMGVLESKSFCFI